MQALSKLNEERAAAEMAPISLTVSDYTLRHLCRLYRVLSREDCHHALLMADSRGLGRAGLVPLAAYLAGCGVKKPLRIRPALHSDFGEQVKQLCLTIGQKDRRSVLVVRNEDVEDEGLFEIRVFLIKNYTCAQNITKDEF